MSASLGYNRELAEEVRLLRLELVSLKARVAELETKVEQEQFVVVSEEASVREFPGVGSSYSQFAGPVPLPVESSASVEPIQQLPVASSGRDQVLIQIGHWLRSSLAGQRRGLSGREKIAESSKLYLVFRNFAGQVFNPVRVCHSFGEAAVEVKPRGIVGDSNFIAVPSEADAQVICKAANVAWPSQLRDGRRS